MSPVKFGVPVTAAGHLFARGNALYDAKGHRAPEIAWEMGRGGGGGNFPLLPP